MKARERGRPLAAAIRKARRAARLADAWLQEQLGELGREVEQLTAATLDSCAEDQPADDPIGAAALRARDRGDLEEARRLWAERARVSEETQPRPARPRAIPGLDEEEAASWAMMNENRVRRRWRLRQLEAQHGPAVDEEEQRDRLAAAAVDAMVALAARGDFGTDDPEVIRGALWRRDRQIRRELNCLGHDDAQERRRRVLLEELADLRVLPLAPPRGGFHAARQARFDAAAAALVAEGTARDLNEAQGLLWLRVSTKRHGDLGARLRAAFRARVRVSIEHPDVRRAAGAPGLPHPAVVVLGLPYQRDPGLRRERRGRPLAVRFNAAVLSTVRYIQTQQGTRYIDWRAATLPLLYHGWDAYLRGRGGRLTLRMAQAKVKAAYYNALHRERAVCHRRHAPPADAE